MPATKRAVDFTNVKEAGAFQPRRVPAGQYRATIAAVDDHKTDNDPNGWVFTIHLKGKRSAYPYYCQSTAKAAWKIRGVFVAAGIAVPKKKLTVDPNKVVGREIGVEMEDDEYEGKPKSIITSVFPTSELTEDAPSENTSDDEADTEDDDDLDEIDLEEI